MAIETGDNFSYKGRKPLDFRDTFDTILDMVSFAESSIDDGHVTYNKETDKHYKFNSTNDVDPILGKWREHNGSSTDEKVKLTAASTDAKYLEDLIDNSTIEIDTVNNCLVVKKIEGQTATVAEINLLSGVTSNIQTQLDNLSKSMRMYGVFNTKADLFASIDPAPVDGNVAIITKDEDNNNKQMTYIYIDNVSKWVKVSECSITVRDFTTNPIDLDKETTGTLSKEKIDAAIARLADVLDKNTYVGSADGIVKKADTLEGLTATIAQINQAINDSHTHPNISALNDIINNGLGNKYLTDNGKYVELISISSKAPTSTYQLWVDITNANNPVLKIHDGTNWIAINGGSSKIDIVKVNGTALPIDSTDNSVNINTYTKTPKWQPSTNYDTVGTEVEYDYKIYSVSTAHTSGTTFEPNNFTFVKYADIDVYSVSQAEYDQLVANGTITDKTRELYCVYDANNNSNTGNSKGINIWVSGEQYEIDNVCIYDDKIYKCKVANSDTDFTPSNWDRISGANVIYVTQTEYDDMKTAGTLSDYDIYIITDGTSSGGSNSVVSPTIAENSENNSDTYKLDITDTNGTFTTPNLKGKDGKSISSIAKDDNNNIIVTFSDGVTKIIGQLNVDVSADFLTSDGFGNLRYYNGHFQYYNTTTSTWIDTSVSPDNVYIMNMIPQNMKSVTGIYDIDLCKNKLKFEEPEDTVINEQVACIVEKVIIRRKLGSEPTDENDGVLIEEIGRKDFGTYKNTYYIDNTFTPNLGETWYYKIIPVSTTGFYNTSSVNTCKGILARDYHLYGFKIDQNESNPASIITYTEDNEDYKSAYMDYENDTFNYGDWGDAWFIKNLKPCMLKYDGTVDYELDKNDYTKKTDGTDSDVANDSYGGNAMVGIPKVYWKIVDNGDNTANIYFSDKKADDDFHCWSHIDNNGNEIDYCYMPIYNGSYVDGKLRSLSGKAPMGNETATTEITYAKSNNTGSDIIWYTELFNDRMLINLLLLLIGKSTDTQTVFGTGNNNSYVSTSNTGIKNTGTMNTKGLFWGNQDNVSGVKVFGIEHWYGNIWRRIGGWINDRGTQKIKMTYGQSDGSTIDGYNETGSGYISIGGATPSGSSSGYISKMLITDNGLIPTIVSGSATTYYCDGLMFNNSQVDYAFVGGNSSYDSRVGALFSSLSSVASFASATSGAALSCKPLATT